ncbi:MAG: ABC transporter ATP-binding protein [Deltaproteobacteria bacterium]|nr:ABC transporter ATP-binding protein [Deltaproteobacteria bacterium]
MNDTGSAPPPADALAIRGLSKTYGSFQAVKSIDLSVGAGRVFGFLGPNGAGKTTTIKIIGGLIAPTAGAVSICGRDLMRDPIGAKSIMGFVPDRPFLYEKLTGIEHLKFVSDLFGMNGAEFDRRAAELLALFELSEWGNQLIENYSHGMKQRLVMASALLHRPRLLVVDEPMVGLDPKGAKMVKEIFRLIAHRQGAAVFMSTHTMAVAEEVCDEVVIINEGSIVARGTVADLRTSGGGADLEDVFLKLTGTDETVPIETVL